MQGSKIETAASNHIYLLFVCVPHLKSVLSPLEFGQRYVAVARAFARYVLSGSALLAKMPAPEISKETQMEFSALYAVINLAKTDCINSSSVVEFLSNGRMETVLEDLLTLPVEANDQNPEILEYYATEIFAQAFCISWMRPVLRGAILLGFSRLSDATKTRPPPSSFQNYASDRITSACVTFMQSSALFVDAHALLKAVQVELHLFETCFAQLEDEIEAKTYHHFKAV